MPLIYPPYPDNYPFGQDGSATHPGGYDGWPSDHPNCWAAKHKRWSINGFRTIGNDA